MIDLFIFSISSWFSLGRLYLCKNLFISSRSLCQNGNFQESSIPGACATSVFASTVSHSWSLPPQETLQDPQVGLARLSCSHCFALGPSAHENLCVPSKSGVSISPSPAAFLHSSPTGLQSQMLWGLLLSLPDPQAGEPDVGLRTLTPVREPLWYNCFPVCGSPTWRVWNLII